nr:hypothetical protein [Tanacetum cinerariifolium]
MYNLTAITRRPRKEILTSPPSLIPSSSSPPLLLPSSSSPPPTRLPSSSHKRSRSPSLPPLPSVSPPPLPSLPLLEHIELVGDDIEILRASLASAMQETATLRARVGLFEQHDVVTQDLLRIARGRITLSQLRAVYSEQEVRELREFWVTDKLEIKELCSRAECAESRLEQSHDRQTGDGSHTQRTDMTEQDIKTFCARAETAKQQSETL